MKKYGNMIGLMRQEIGLSQVELARQTGVGEKFVRRLEKEEVELTDSRVIKIMYYLSSLWHEYCKDNYLKTKEQDESKGVISEKSRTREKQIMSSISKILIRRRDHEKV